MRIKIVSLVLMLVFLTSFTLSTDSVNARENQNLSDVSIIRYKYRDLTYEEVVKGIAEKRKVSIEEAKDYLEYNFGTQSIYDIYREYTAEQSFGMGMTVEYGFYARLYAKWPVRYFVEILFKWENESGSGFYTYENFYHSTVIDYDKVYESARGQIEVVVEYSTEHEASIGIEKFISAGYSVTHGIGLTYYFRKTQSYSKTWDERH